MRCKAKLFSECVFCISSALALHSKHQAKQFCKINKPTLKMFWLILICSFQETGANCRSLLVKALWLDFIHFPSN